MKVLITGAGGQVGQELCFYAKSQGFETVALNSAQLDISNQQAVHDSVKHNAPDIVINAAAYTAVDKAEQDAERAYAVNRDGAAYLAQACAAQRIPLLHLSTDYVFDGSKDGAYQEHDVVSPLGVYGDSKWQGEQAIRQTCPQAVIVRVSWVFGAHGHNFVRTMLRLAQEREELRVVADQRGCPTPAASIAQALLKIATHLTFSNGSVFGTYHYCGSPAISWHGFAEVIVEQAAQMEPFAAKLAVKRIVPITSADYPTPAQRPMNSVLDCSQIKRVFALEPADWRTQLHQVLLQWSGIQ